MKCSVMQTFKPVFPYNFSLRIGQPLKLSWLHQRISRAGSGMIFMISILLVTPPHCCSIQHLEGHFGLQLEGKGEALSEALTCLRT